jgi:hypothetical protein
MILPEKQAEYKINLNERLQELAIIPMIALMVDGIR